MTDVFSHYIEPEVEQAALDLLYAVGYEVEILPVIGAGASLHSKGFLNAARRHAASVLDAIQARGGASVVGLVACEPPEAACLKHEYAALLPERRAEIKSIASRAWLVDEFLLRSDGFNELRVARRENQEGQEKEQAKENLIRFSASTQAIRSPIRSNLHRTAFGAVQVSIPHPLTTSVGDLRESAAESANKLTFHPHCHQRAEPPADDCLPSGPEATVALLRAAGFEVEVTEAGCCGMAGTFGYDAAHYELSMKVGELSVLPRLRAAGHVTATGAACRMQIQQGAGKVSAHPLVLARDRFLGKPKG